MALQEYIPTQWIDGTAPAINATNLNHIEEGIEGVTTQSITNNTAIIDLEIRVEAIETDPVSDIPIGLICMWQGATVPTGWMLCDGQNGTPNLVDKFVRGVAPNDIGMTGGYDHTELLEHSHDRGSFEITGSFEGRKTSSDGSDALLLLNTGAFTRADGAGATSVYMDTPGGTFARDVYSFTASNTWSGRSSTEGTGTSTQDRNRPPYYWRRNRKLYRCCQDIWRNHYGTQRIQKTTYRFTCKNLCETWWTKLPRRIKNHERSWRRTRNSHRSIWS